MNKNPTRPEDIDQIISDVFDKKETEFEKYKKVQDKIIMELFE